MKISQLEKKYPKGFDKFINEMKLDYDYLESEDIRCYWKEITDFMDKQGIKISLDVEDWIFYQGKISFIRDIENLFIYTPCFKFRKQAETKAIAKAFEVLENRLKEQK